MAMTDIVGYTYRAENYTPTALIELLIADGSLTAEAREIREEDALTALAAQRGIDRMDEWSFDSDDFPKVIFDSQVTEDDYGWLGW